MEFWLLIGGMLILMYFMMYVPQKRRIQQQNKMLNSLTQGDRVMLTSGIFGTVCATGDRQLVIELAPGVEITVVKQAIAKVLDPDEEEFVFTDAELAEELGENDGEQTDQAEEHNEFGDEMALAEAEPSSPEPTNEEPAAEDNSGESSEADPKQI